MATSSSAKKKATPAKRKSSAKTSGVTSKGAGRIAKKTTTKSKTLSLSNRKRTKPPPKEAAAPVVLPSDLPVTSQPPRFPREASALRPGSLLRESCNGRDIQLARGACVEPSFEKRKGKFLLVFPGNFSFGRTDLFGKQHNDKKNGAAAASSDPSAGAPKDGGGDEDQTARTSPVAEDHDGKVPPPETIEQESTATSASSSTTMGRVVGLRTDNPTFRIPFPHLGKTLVFEGKKIATTSKYLALSCSNKKNGTVQCKNIFSSAVVFRTPKWESSSESGKLVLSPIGTATNGATIGPTTATESIGTATVPQSSVDQTNDAKTSTIVCDDCGNDGKKTGHSFSHYGGSERSVDGEKRSGRKTSNGSSRSDPGKSGGTEDRVPIWSNYSGDDIKRSSDFDFSSVLKARAGTKTTFAKPEMTRSRETSSDDEEKYSDSDDDYDGGRKGTNDSKLSTKRTRSAPRRQVSMSQKSYAEKEEEEESDEDDTDDSDRDEETEERSSKNRTGDRDNKQKRSSARESTTRTPSPGTKGQQKQKSKKKTSTGKKTVTKKEAIDLDDKIDEKCPRSKKQEAKKAKPKTSTRKKTVVKEEVIDVDDESDDDDSLSDVYEAPKEAKSVNSAQRRRTPSRKSRNTKETNYKDIEESDIEEESGTDDESEEEDTSKASSSYDDKSVSKRSGKAKTTPAAKKRRAPGSAAARARSKSVGTTKTPVSSKRKAAANPSSQSKSVSPGTVTPGGEKRQRKDSHATVMISEEKVSVIESVGTPSPGGIKSPFRRRHKKKSPAKSARSKVLDLTQDDEFAFG